MRAPKIDYTSETALLHWCRSNGVEVVEAELPKGFWGLYRHLKRIIFLQAGMKKYQRIATLGHEVLHACNAHDGKQPAHVEEALNRFVASQLISVDTWKEISPLVQGLPDRPAEDSVWRAAWKVARTFQVPWWVITAYRDALGLQAAL